MKWNVETKKSLQNAIQTFFYEERGEEIGDLATGHLLDFISEKIGPAYYNQGVKDAMKQAEVSGARLEEDLFALMRPMDK